MKKRRLPPLKALPAFERTAQHLSFSAAADDLHLTHGAISRQIKSIEDCLGVPLFRRSSRRVELTEAGVSFLDAVRTALHVLETSVTQFAELQARGPLVVSCLPTFMMRWLIPRLHEFYERHPAIEVRLSASQAGDEAPREGVGIAIGIGHSPTPASPEEYPFLAERCGPVCSPALLQRLPLRQPSDLRRHVLLHTQSRPDAWSDWAARSHVEGVEFGAGLRFEHFYYLLEAAVAGLGVAVAPHPLVAQDLERGKLVAPFGFRPSGRFYLLRSASSPGRLASITAFKSWIMAAALREPPVHAATGNGCDVIWRDDGLPGAV